MRRHARLYVLGLLLAAGLGVAVATRPAQGPSPEQFREQSRAWSERAEATGLADPFTGVTTNGRIVPGQMKSKASPKAYSIRPRLASRHRSSAVRLRSPIARRVISVTPTPAVSTKVAAKRVDSGPVHGLNRSYGQPPSRRAPLLMR